MRQRVLTILGMAFFLPLLRGDFFGTFFLGCIPEYVPSSAILIVVNMATIVVSGLLALCLPRLTVTPKPRTYRVGTLVLCAVTTAVLCFFALPVPIWPLVCISLPLAVLSFCVLSVAWVAALRSRVAENGAMLFADIAIGYVLSFVATPPGVEGITASVLLKAPLPLVSGVSWFLLQPSAQMDMRMRATTGHEGRQDIAIAMPAALLPLMTVALLVSGVLVGFFVPAGNADTVYPTRYIFSVALSVPVALLAVRRHPHTMSISVFLSCAVIFLGTLMLISTSRALVDIGADAMTAGRRLLWTLFLIAVLGAAQQITPDKAVFMGCVLPIAFTVTRVPINVLRMTDPIAGLSANNTYLISILLAILLIACSLALAWIEAMGVLRKTSTRNVNGGYAEVEMRAIAIDRIANDHGLTERELEAFRYLAAGHTVRRIAEMLGVTESTVRSHSKTIYRKIGCHSKQDLIDMVNEATRRGTGRDIHTADNNGLVHNVRS